MASSLLAAALCRNKRRGEDGDCRGEADFWANRKPDGGNRRRKKFIFINLSTVQVSVQPEGCGSVRRNGSDRPARASWRVHVVEVLKFPMRCCWQTGGLQTSGAIPVGTYCVVCTSERPPSAPQAAARPVLSPCAARDSGIADRGLEVLVVENEEAEVLPRLGIKTEFFKFYFFFNFSCSTKRAGVFKLLKIGLLFLPGLSWVGGGGETGRERCLHILWPNLAGTITLKAGHGDLIVLEI